MTENRTRLTNRNVYAIVQCKKSSEFNKCSYTYMSAYTPIYDMTEKIEMTKKKVAVVTGSSSGIGYETALLLARNGFDTFATMRHCQNYHCKTWYPISINFRHLTSKHIDYSKFAEGQDFINCSEICPMHLLPYQHTSHHRCLL